MKEISFDRYRDKVPPSYLNEEQAIIFQELKASYPTLEGIHYIMIIYAKKTLDRCLTYAEHLMNIIETFDLQHLNTRQIQRILKMNMILALPPQYHTVEHHGILWVKGRNLEPNLFTEQEVVQCIYFVLMLLMHASDDNIRKGIVVICDLRDFGMKNIDFKLEKIIKHLFGCLPIRFKRAWIINAPWYISAIMKVFRPFMSQKVLSRYCLSSEEEMRESFHETKLPSVYSIEETISTDKEESEDILNFNITTLLYNFSSHDSDSIGNITSEIHDNESRGSIDPPIEESMD